MIRSLVVLAALAVSGCASTSTMGLARTLNRGAVQGWVAAEGGANIPVTTTPGSTTTTAVGFPNVEGGVRFGASDTVELGAKLGFSGIGFEGKFALLRPETMDNGVNVSIAPQASIVGIAVPGAGIGNLTAQLPVLIGIDFSGHELVFGPRLHNQFAFGSVNSGSQTDSVTLNLLSAGLTIGFAIKVGSVRIVPEIAALVPFFAAVGANSGSANTGQVIAGAGVGGFSLQAGVGFLFGTRDAYERPAPRSDQPVPQPMPYPVQPIPADAPPMPPPSNGESTGEMTPLPPPPPPPMPQP